MKGTASHGLHYTRNTDSPDLASFADADFTNSENRKSQEGAMQVAFGAPIGWSQKTVSLSTCEAEYLAASHALQELFWIDHISTFLPSFKASYPLPMHVDNKSAVLIANNSARRNAENISKLTIIICSTIIRRTVSMFVIFRRPKTGQTSSRNLFYLTGIKSPCSRTKSSR